MFLKRYREKNATNDSALGIIFILQTKKLWNILFLNIDRRHINQVKGAGNVIICQAFTINCHILFLQFLFLQAH